MNRNKSEEWTRQFRDRLVEDEKSSATIQKYIRDVEKFLSFIGEEEITKEIVVSYKQYLMKHYKPVSVNSMLTALNCFLKEMGWLSCTVKTIKVQRQSFRPQEKELSKAEYYRLLSAARSKKDIRLYLLMQTICSTGIRVSELPFITVEAIRAGRAEISMKGKNRIILIPGSLCRELKKFIKRRNIQAGSVFVTRSGKNMDRSNILHEMKKLCKDAGVERQKVFPHNLRHLFACLFYKEEKDLSRLADILGHSSINTTRIYTCVSGGEQIRQIERLGLVVIEKKKTT